MERIDVVGYEDKKLGIIGDFILDQVPRGLTLPSIFPLINLSFVLYSVPPSALSFTPSKVTGGGKVDKSQWGNHPRGVALRK